MVTLHNSNPEAGMSAWGQTRSFGDVSSMSGLPESGHAFQHRQGRRCSADFGLAARSREHSLRLSPATSKPVLSRCNKHLGNARLIHEQAVSVVGPATPSALPMRSEWQNLPTLQIIQAG